MYGELPIFGIPARLICFWPAPPSDIKNRLGHENLKSTTVYLYLALGQGQQIQKKFITYTQSLLNQDDKIDELTNWENKEELLNWLDSL